MAGTPRSAKNAKIRIGATSLYFAEWEVNPAVDDLDATTFESGGFYVPVGGILKAEITMSGYFDATQNPFDSPPNLQPGQFVSTLKLYINDTTGPFYLFNSAMVVGTPTTARVRELVMIRAQLVGNGSWSYPTGAA